MTALQPVHHRAFHFGQVYLTSFQAWQSLSGVPSEQSLVGDVRQNA